MPLPPWSIPPALNYVGLFLTLKVPAQLLLLHQRPRSDRRRGLRTRPRRPRGRPRPPRGVEAAVQALPRPALLRRDPGERRGVRVRPAPRREGLLLRQHLRRGLPDALEQGRPRGRRAARRRHRGPRLAVEETRIEDFRPDVRFDAVVMCDVLEHLADPRGALERCRDLLAPGGVLFVQVPNLVGFHLPPSHGWGLPHHLWQFGPRSLALLATAAGLRPQRWYTGVLGVIGVYERGGPALADRVLWWAARRLRVGNRL